MTVEKLEKSKQVYHVMTEIEKCVKEIAHNVADNQVDLTRFEYTLHVISDDERKDIFMCLFERMKILQEKYRSDFERI